MANLVDDLRLRSMFSKLFNPSVTANAVSSSPDDSNMSDTNSDVKMNPDIGSSPESDMDISKLFPMQHEASDRLKSVLDTMPQRSQFQPSRFQKIMAGIAGMGAGGPAAYEHGAALGFKNNPEEQFKITHAMLDEPYNKAVSDWELKMKPLQELAVAERGENTNSRIAANNYLQTRDRNRAIDQRDTASERTYQGRLASVAQRDRYLEFKQWEAKNSGKGRLIKSDNEGYVYSIGPDNTIEYLYSPETGERLKSDKLPEAERMRIQQNNKIAAQNNQGSVTRQNQNNNETNQEKIEDKREANRQKDITSRGNESRKTKGTAPGVNPNSGKSSTDKGPGVTTTPIDVATLNGKEATIGKLYKLKNGTLAIYAGNGHYRPTGKVEANAPAK